MHTSPSYSSQAETATDMVTYYTSTTVAVPGQKRPATHKWGWHYDAATFPFGKHQPWGDWDDEVILADVLAKHVGLFDIDLDLYKPGQLEVWQRCPVNAVITARGYQPYVRRSDEPRSLKYRVFVPDPEAWWPAAGKLGILENGKVSSCGEFRSAGLVPSPGQPHGDGGIYALVPGRDRVQYPSGGVLLGNVIVLDEELKAACIAAGAHTTDEQLLAATDLELPADDGRCPLALTWLANRNNFDDASSWSSHGEHAWPTIKYLKERVWEGHLIGGVIGEVRALMVNTSDRDFEDMWNRVMVDANAEYIRFRSCCNDSWEYLKSNLPATIPLGSIQQLQVAPAHMNGNSPAPAEWPIARTGDLWLGNGILGEQHTAQSVLTATCGWARYTSAGVWIAHRGDAWDECKPSEITAAAARAAMARFVPSAAEGTDAERHNKLAVQLLTSKYCAAVATKMEAISVLDRVIVSTRDLDADGAVIWAGGKCWDIATGTVLENRRGQPHLKSANFTPASGNHPGFDGLCETLFPDKKLREWALLTMSRCYLGVPHKNLIELKGAPETGKSPWAFYHAEILGSYAQVISEAVLGKEDAELAFGSIPGSRMAYLDEYLDIRGARPANRIKSLTNGQKFTARVLYGKPAVYSAKHTFCVSLNEESSLPYNDAGVEKRVIRIPFKATGDVRGAVEKAYATLPGEGPAVLGTMLTLAAALLRQPRLGTMTDAPQAAKDHLAASVLGADVLAEFIGECKDLRGTPPREWTPGSQLWAQFGNFRQFSRAQGGPQSLTAFGRKLSELGYESASGSYSMDRKCRPLSYAAY